MPIEEVDRPYILEKEAVLLLYINPDNKQEALTVSRKDNYNSFGLPGGKVEYETFIQALIREVKEELGIKIEKEHIQFLYQNRDNDFIVNTYLYTKDLEFNNELPYVNSEGALVSFQPISKLVNAETSLFSDYNLKMFFKFATDDEFISYQK